MRKLRDVNDRLRAGLNLPFVKSEVLGTSEVAFIILDADKRRNRKFDRAEAAFNIQLVESHEDVGDAGDRFALTMGMTKYRERLVADVQEHGEIGPMRMTMVEPPEDSEATGYWVMYDADEKPPTWESMQSSEAGADEVASADKKPAKKAPKARATK